MTTMLRTLTIAAILLACSTSLFAQEEPLATATLYDLTETVIPLDLEVGALACLEYCVELEVLKERYECAPVLAPPVIGCDLPWIDPQRPTGLPPWNIMEWCIPQEPTFIGYALHEDRSRVKRLVRHNSDCTSTSEDTVIEVLPDLGNAGRKCPDGGPWVQENETITSLRFTGCP